MNEINKIDNINEMNEEIFKERLKNGIKFCIENEDFMNKLFYLQDLFPRLITSDYDYEKIFSKFVDIPEDLIDTYVDNAWLVYKNDKKIEEITGKEVFEIEEISDFKEEHYKKKEHISLAITNSFLMSFGAVALGFIVFLTKISYADVKHMFMVAPLLPIVGFLIGLQPYAFFKGLIDKKKIENILKDKSIDEFVKEKIQAEEIVYNIENKGRVK